MFEYVDGMSLGGISPSEDDGNIINNSQQSKQLSKFEKHAMSLVYIRK